MDNIIQFIELLGSNVIYLALLVGMWLAITAVYVPGLGFPEAGALTGLAVALAGLLVLPTNPVGVLLLAAALGCFLALLVFRQSRWLIAVGFVLQVLGSVFLFRVEARPAFWIIVLGNLAALAYHQLILLPGLAIQGKTSPLDADALVGTLAEVVTTIDPVGSVRIQGEVWSARADQLIESGSTVRVVGRNGLHLRVVRTDPVRAEHPIHPA